MIFTGPLLMPGRFVRALPLAATKNCASRCPGHEDIDIGRFRNGIGLTGTIAPIAGPRSAEGVTDCVPDAVIIHHCQADRASCQSPC